MNRQQQLDPQGDGLRDRPAAPGRARWWRPFGVTAGGFAGLGSGVPQAISLDALVAAAAPGLLADPAHRQ